MVVVVQLVPISQTCLFKNIREIYFLKETHPIIVVVQSMRMEVLLRFLEFQMFH